jgi:RHS repeat-associated protein
MRIKPRLISILRWLPKSQREFLLADPGLRTERQRLTSGASAPLGFFRYLFLLTCFAIIPGFALAQDPQIETGFQAYGTYHVFDFDSVNVQNHNLDLRIPIVSYHQRGDLPELSLNLLYRPITWAMRQTATSGGPIDYYYPTTYSGEFGGVWDHIPSVTVYHDYSTLPYVYAYHLIDSNGAHHILGWTSSTEMETVDGSGFRVVGASGNSGGTYRTDGNGIIYGLNGSVMQDTKGNVVTATTQNTLIDSIGRTIPQIPGYSAGNPPPSSPGCTTYNFPGVNGGTAPFVFCYANYTITSNFQNPPIQDRTYTIIFLQSVTLPSLAKWSFSYDSWGDLVSITTPTGGTVSYNWYTNTNAYGCYFVYPRAVSSRTVDANDGTGPKTWSYNLGIVTDPLGNDTVYTFTAPCGGSAVNTETQYYSGSHSNAANLIKTEDTQYAVSGGDPFWPTDGGSSAPYSTLPVLKKTTWANGQVSEVCMVYDSMTGGPCSAAYNPSGSTFFDRYSTSGKTYPFVYGSVVQKSEYDYGSGSPGPLLRQTNTQFQWQANNSYRTANLLRQPASTTILDGGAHQIAQTTFGYDENNGSPQGVFGNQTSVTRWSNIGASPKTQGIYNSQGMAIKKIDANLNTTQITYDSTGAFPSQIQYPTTNGVAHLEKFSYDSNTGLLNSHTDQSNNSTSYQYDSMRRITSASYPGGGQATYCYTDAGGPTCTQSAPLKLVTTQIASPSPDVVTTTVYDGLGRMTQTQLNPGSAGIYTDTTYDALGRIYSVSNPHFSGPSPTDGTTTNFYDALGRICLVVPPDGTLPSGSGCPVSQPSNDIFTTYSGNTATVTDQAGKSRKSITDALGRLTTVYEAPAGLNYQTTYGYDALGNLTSVLQNGSRQRTFVYDSLSRLTSATNPESGILNYTYDADGNLVTKTSPAPNQTGSSTVSLSYCYDALNRLLSKAYTVLSCPMSTPVAAYIYDQTSAYGLIITNGIGHRTSMVDPAGSEAWSYDAMGRVAADQRTTVGSATVTKTTTNLYNLAGNAYQVTYPTGRTISYSFDGANRPSAASDPSTGTSYATGFKSSPPSGCSSSAVCYTPSGAIYAMSIGQTSTFTGLNLTNTYNNRLQPLEFKASSSGGNALDLSYNFVDTSGHNNGNVIGIINNLDATRSQNFTYDSLNRIYAAQTSSNYSSSPAHCWAETYSYDAWGNFYASGANSTTQSAYTGCVQEGARVSTPNIKNQFNEYCYDAAGNIVDIPAPLASCPAQSLNQNVYDAENHLVTASGTNYLYDGDGRRVAKTGSKLYWYGSDGSVLAETDASGNTAAEYVYFAGERIARIAGGPLTVQNPSFETYNPLTTSCGTGCAFNGGPIPGWNSGGSGSFQPNSTYFNLPLPSGSIVAYSNGHLISQDLTGVSVQPNSTYTLSVDVGNRLDHLSGGYLISLQAGSTVLASLSGSATTITPGNFATQTLTYTSGATVPSGDLTIVLTSTSTSSQGDFDNVRLNGSTIYYYVSDHLGTARVVTSASGVVLDDSDFYPFGAERSYLSSSGNSYKFTGKERDSESGLDNFGARYNSSSMGRFMTPDPLLNSGRPWEPQSWNRYAYARNNPLNIIDPTGLYDLASNCREDKKCRQHADDLKNGLKNLQNKLKNVKDPQQKARLEAALNAIGTEGDKNGVNVSFGATKGGGAGETTPVSDPQTYKETYNVTLDPSKLNSQDEYAMAGAHEGTHVDDFSTELANPNGQPLLSDFSLEYRGYQTSAYAWSALGHSSLSMNYDGKSSVIWNGSWGAVDKNITNFVTQFHDRNGHPDHPETTPHNPWPN